MPLLLVQCNPIVGPARPPIDCLREHGLCCHVQLWYYLWSLVGVSFVTETMEFNASEVDGAMKSLSHVKKDEVRNKNISD